MEKDLAKLREKEAQTERERIAGLKTEDYLRMERERQEQAKKEAEERQRMEEEAKRKEEELKILKKNREQREAEITQKEAEAKEFAGETFQKQLRETQEKEEEERRKFVERVSAEAEGRPIMPEPNIPEAPAVTPPEVPVLPPEEPPAPTVPPPIPVPPVAPPLPAEVPVTPETKVEKPGFKFSIPKIPIPKIPSIPTPKITGYFPKGPSLFEKLWIRIVISLLVFAILAAVATFWYWYLVVKEAPAATTPALSAPAVTTPPTAIITTENERVLGVSGLNEIPGLIAGLVQEDLGQPNFTRILIKDKASGNFLGLQEFFGAFQVKTPAGFYDKLDNDFTLFIHATASGANRLGFVTRAKNGGASAYQSLKDWELTMEKDTDGLFGVLGKTAAAPNPSFKTASYKSVSFDYLSFPPDNFGIVWSIVDQYLVFTSSGESAIKTIDKLVD